MLTPSTPPRPLPRVEFSSDAKLSVRQQGRGVRLALPAALSEQPRLQWVLTAANVSTGMAATDLVLNGASAALVHMDPSLCCGFLQ